MHNITLNDSEEIERTIIGLLSKETRQDLSIQEIAVKTRLHRNTVSKYIFALEKSGKITHSRTVGRAKMYRIAEEE